MVGSSRNQCNSCLLRLYIDGLIQKRHNPIANALELRFFRIKLSISNVI